MLECGGLGGQGMKLEGSEWAGKEQRTANVALRCGGTSWLVSRIITYFRPDMGAGDEARFVYSACS